MLIFSVCSVYTSEHIRKHFKKNDYTLLLACRAVCPYYYPGPNLSFRQTQRGKNGYSCFIYIKTSLAKMHVTQPLMFTP